MTPDALLTPDEERAVRAAARPYLQAALRQGLVIGFILGAVAVCIVLAVVGGGQ